MEENLEELNKYLLSVEDKLIHIKEKIESDEGYEPTEDDISLITEVLNKLLV